MWRFDRRDLDRYNALFAGPNRLCRRRRQVDDPALHVRTAVFDHDDGALAVARVGDSGLCSERQGLARRVIRVRVHPRAADHLFARQAVAVVRLARPRLAGVVGRMSPM